ncbi:MAG: pyridoxamine 5'-phosphate oxidase family protein, partial [Pseudomonadota bacterium]
MSVSEIAFTEAVRAVQERLGSRAFIEEQISARDWRQEIDADLAAFIAVRDSLFLATVNGTGQPYIQHRGGPPGFVKPLGPRALGFADFAGNRQYISIGNLSESDKVALIMVDHASSTRIKIWGRARVVEDDAELIAGLHHPEYQARPERAIVIEVDAWDVNCPQHIPQLYPEEVIRQVTAKLAARLAELEAENAELRQWMGK